MIASGTISLIFAILLYLPHVGKQVKDVTRANCKGVVAGTLDEVRKKAAEKFGKTDIPNIHLDSDGTEIDDEDYFQTLEPNAELIAVFADEQWIDVSNHVFAYYTCVLNEEYVSLFPGININPNISSVHVQWLINPNDFFYME